MNDGNNRTIKQLKSRTSIVLQIKWLKTVSEFYKQRPLICDCRAIKNYIFIFFAANETSNIFFTELNVLLGYSG